MEYLIPNYEFKEVYKRNPKLAYRGNPLHYTDSEGMDLELKRLEEYNKIMQRINPKLLKNFKLSKSDSANFKITYEPRDYDYLASFAVPDLIKLRDLNPIAEGDLRDSERLEAVVKNPVDTENTTIKSKD